MPSADDVYIHCDELDNIPQLSRENWEFEITLLTKKLSPDATVLQVGCMDGTRIIKLLRTRPDLKITGLDIEEGMAKRCRENLEKTGLQATVVLGDITNPPGLPHFDYVVCLNNTLGYIEDQEAAIKSMRSLGDRTIISVYGEKFTNDLAREYFNSIGLNVATIEGNVFHMEDFTNVRRYMQSDAERWGGQITETPIGYFCEIGVNG
jgi:SAM-dependent methyltransferase